MFNLADIFSRRDPGLPASMLRDNSGPMPALPGPLTDEQVHENINAAPGSKRFVVNFIEPGLVLYRGKNGAADEWVLIEDDALERMAKTLIGKPVIDWDHAEVWPEIIGDGQADGVCYDVWKDADPKSDTFGWWNVGYILWTKSAIEHAESGDWSVSCAYSETETDGKAGRYHNIDYQTKILDGVYTHLAQVKNPRYEKARIRANSTKENGGYKMAFKLSDLIPGKKHEPEVLRLNAAEGAATHLDVDGAAVPVADLVAKHNAAATRCMTASDEDVVEHEGKQYKVGELRNSYRNAMASERKNAEDKEKAEKEKADKEKAEKERANAETQLAGAGAEGKGKLAGAGAAKADGPADNPDKALEAGKELAAAKERLNSLETELKELKSAPSRELREAANLRFAPVGGEPEGQGFVTVEDRIRAGNDAFALK